MYIHIYTYTYGLRAQLLGPGFQQLGLVPICIYVYIYAYMYPIYFILYVYLY